MSYFRNWLLITLGLWALILSAVFAATAAQLHYLAPVFPLLPALIAAPFIAAVMVAMGISGEVVKVALLFAGIDDG